MLKQFVVGVAVAVMLAGVAQAGQYEDGYAAYFFGDYAKALRLLRPLANQGNADAQYNLGTMYDNGLGVQEDDSEAVKWYRLAADQGNAEARYYLGIMHEQGYGVSQDYAEAVKWYRLAADQGFARAQYNLGNSYINGEGVPQDYVLAHMWLNLAATRGYGFEGFEGIAEKQRDLAAIHMTADQIAEAQRLAQDWKPVADAE